MGVAFAGDVAWHVLEAILATDENIRLCGMHAMDSCRLEKGFRHYGHDLSNEDHVLEADSALRSNAKKPPVSLALLSAKMLF